MIKYLRFIKAAAESGVAYIDCDGTVLEKCWVPDSVNDKLLWWSQNLTPTAPVMKRIRFLYFVRWLTGARLVLWTNRAPYHEYVTRQALGKHAKLFSSMQFRAGQKDKDVLFGPVMDDQPDYLKNGCSGGLWVSPKPGAPFNTK